MSLHWAHSHFFSFVMRWQICFADNSEEWKVVRGKFVAINAVTMSCSCDLSPLGLSPACHLGDGCLDLLLMSHCSRFQFLRALIRTTKGEHVRFEILLFFFSRTITHQNQCSKGIGFTWSPYFFMLDRANNTCNFGKE